LPLTSNNRCVPELMEFSDVAERNTCQFLGGPLTCASYIAQTVENCESEVLFAPKECSWNYDSLKCEDYVVSDCELTTFTSAPTDYNEIYEACYAHTNPVTGRICLPKEFPALIENEAAVYGCDVFRPINITCDNFNVGNFSEEACGFADGQVYSYAKPSGQVGMFGLQCEYDATNMLCQKRTGPCVETDTSNTSDLFSLAVTCYAASTPASESVEEVFCWPMLESFQDEMSFNVCDTGKDRNEIHCDTEGLFNDSDQCTQAHEWGNPESVVTGSELPFPELENCNWLDANDGVAQAGCYDDLPSDTSGCGLATFDAVPGSFEEYFNLCSSVQREEPYSPNKACIPSLTTLDGALVDQVKCKTVWAPVRCEYFDIVQGSNTDYCDAANGYIFAEIGADSDIFYGISCSPNQQITANTVRCEKVETTCTGITYMSTAPPTTASPATADSTAAPDESTDVSEWELYNGECMSANATPTTTAPPTTGETTPETSLGPLYCMAEVMNVNEEEKYNTCSTVPSELNCSLPRFQSQEACDTMKDLEIPKLDDPASTFTLGCKWVADDTNRFGGECKSGMAKLLVPALMVLASLLF